MYKGYIHIYIKKVCTQQSKKFIFHKAILTNVGNKESEYNTSLSVLYFFFFDSS